MSTRDFYLLDTWNKTLALIKETGNIEDNIFNQYYSQSKLYELTNTSAIIVVPAFVNKAVLNSELALVNNSISKIVNENIECEIVIERDFIKREEKPVVKKSKFNYFSEKLNTNYNFNNFIVGKSNKQAQIAAMTCATNPGELYNPLFIYGNSGLGKTHLLNSIGNYMKSQNPSLKVALLSGLDFVEAVFKSIKNNEIDDFKHEMYQLDLLLVDDIQFIAGKQKTHEIFFSIFNVLVNNHKQIVITSDRMPNEIKELEERIISRFNSGLNVNICSPELQTSINILRYKLANSTILTKDVDDDVVQYIATNFSQDVRKLEGALNRLLFYSINFSESESINIDVAKLAFNDELASSSNKTSSKELNIDKIIKCVADYYNLNTSQLLSKTRTKNIANARHIALYLSREMLDLPYSKIGKSFGGRDHSTAMNSYNKINKQLKNDNILKQAILDLKIKIKK